jgi:hypothetical protein
MEACGVLRIFSLLSNPATGVVEVCPPGFNLGILTEKPANWQTL